MNQTYQLLISSRPLSQLLGADRLRAASYYRLEETQIQSYTD